MTVAATATASMQGVPQPWNVAIVLDATGSMSDAPPTGSCTTNTEFACALAGVQTLLQNVPNSSGEFPRGSVLVPECDNALRSPTTGHAAELRMNEPYTFPVTNLAGYTPLNYASRLPGLQLSRTQPMRSRPLGRIRRRTATPMAS